MNSTFRTLAALSIAVVAALVAYIAFRHGDSSPAPATRPQPPATADVLAPAVEDQTPPPSEPPVPPTLEILPASFALTGPGDACQLVVMQQSPDGCAADLTRSCEFELSPQGRAEISKTGYLRAIQPGEIQITARSGQATAETTFTIANDALPVSDFALDIVPILTKAGCNSGQCHGAAQGKGGLQLSLFGYDPQADHAALTRGLEGRRVDPFNPQSSLILLKPTLAMPHGGGLRIRPGSVEEDRLIRWLEAGTPWLDEQRGRLQKLAVEPSDRFLASAPAEEQLRVIAEYEDGARRDVTRLCLFVSNDPATASVDKNGSLKMLRRGQADVVVRFANKLAKVRVAAPFNDQLDFDYSSIARRNFIDDAVLDQLRHMRLPVSTRSSDAEFLRRVYFDLVGHMPDAGSRDEAHVVEEFLADSSPDKRDKLIDRLLEHPDFAAFWALRFGDLLQVNSATMGRAAGSYKIWLAKQLALDKSRRSIGYDNLVRSLLLSRGSLAPGQLSSNNAARVYYASPAEVGEIAEQAARRFLGIRIRCARCHDHPLDVWTQDDYYGFAAFFGGVRVDTANGAMAQEVRIVSENSVVHLRTGEKPQPTFLGGQPADPAGREDVRELLVDWMFHPDNPQFARMAANWIWAHLLGRGLVEPYDDMRETNPPSDPALLDQLATHFRQSGYDLRAFVRTICQSETYQRTSTPLPGNEQDEKFYSHALLKPLTAHQMADAIAQVTRVPHSYGQNLGKGTRAIDINDPNINDYLLDILGRCDRTGGCEVGALARPASLKLALHLIIGDAINGKLIRQGSLANDMSQYVRNMEPADRQKVWEQQIQTIYLRAYCRPPTDAETAFWIETLASIPDPAEAIEDMMWAILNSREFAMNH